MNSVCSFFPPETNTEALGVASQLLGRIIENELTEKQRDYIRLYYFDGLTVESIAESDGVNKSTVSRTLARGRKKIENSLKYVISSGCFFS